ncbi:MAG: PKD domain-containing protein [Bacteroidia bacterium]|nr:PKD domain-containing protein [Bacteroidia bacterium]
MKDSSGLVGTTIRTLSVTKPPNKAPTASFTVSPETGTVSALFAFDASGCTDAETPVGQLQVRWDWDGNGTWTPFTETKTASHLYAQAGSYTVVMEVKDGDGLTSTVSKTITVSATAVAAAAAAATPVVVPDGNITDPRDKNTYPYKRIGTQTWMIKNLAWLPAVSPSKDGSETSPYYYVYAYHGSSVSAAKATPNYATYGVLYNWEAAKKACPSGWHLPSDDEWKVLEKYLGMSEADANTYNNRRSGVVGGKLKESGTGHWRSPNQGANNSSGFMALPGGNRGNDRVFDILVNYAYFWSSSESGSLSVWSRDLDYGSDGVGRYVSSRSVGFSVRCLRND